MLGRPAYGGAAKPVSLREANGLAFLHRERARFRAGTSALLGLTFEPAAGSGFLIDVGAVHELYEVKTAASGIATIGAFASLAAIATGIPSLLPAEASTVAARLRLALLDAQVRVLGLGRTRTARVDGLTVAPHEIPVAIEVAPAKPGVGIAERRRATVDGDASFVLGVSAALRVSVLGRYEGARIVVDLDGEIFRATEAEERLDRQRVQPESLHEAARLAAHAIDAVDARSSAIARAVVPLAFAALRDANTAARATLTPADEGPRRSSGRGSR